MTTFHAVVWMDRREAHVVMFDRDHIDASRIRSRSHHHASGGHVGSHQQMHGRGDIASGHHSPAGGHDTADARYHGEVAAALAGVHEILVTGPAQARNEFKRWCELHDKAVNAAIVDVIPADHPSDEQLVAMARKYFRKHDRTTADPSQR
jgi:hypothetical protein